MQTPRVLVVLLNWNSPRETVAAVEAVLRSRYPSFEILIVDNGSTDESVAHLRTIVGERVQLIEVPENLGYTGGCNLGMKRALELGVDYVWLLNNDAVVPPETLGSLVLTAESDPKIGLVTPMTATETDPPLLTFAGGVVWPEVRRYDETNDPAEAEAWEAQYPGRSLALGTAMLVRTSLIREIGMLDDRFFAYFEDIDYSARSIAAGYRNVVDRSVVVRHVQKSRETRPLEIRPHFWYYMARNESRFWRKHVGLRRSLRPTAGALLRFLVNLNACASKPESTAAIQAGLWDGWLDRGGAYDRRSEMPWAVASVVSLLARHPRFRFTPRSPKRVPVPAGSMAGAA